MRLFVAIELQHAWRAALARLLESAPPGRGRGGVRWVRPESLHLTLWFLGDVEDERLADVKAAVAAASAALPPFELRMGALGCFPSRGRPRVLWVGADDAAGGCQRWIDAARPGLTALGFEADERPFQPHITLARADEREAGEALQALTQRMAVRACGPMPVEAVTLFCSRLSRHGAVYEALTRARLGLSGGGTGAPDRGA